VVTERQAELLLGEGRHPDADRIEPERLEEGKSPAAARRATMLGRPIEHNQSEATESAKERSPWLAMDLTFRAQSMVQIAWALLDDETRLVLEPCPDIAWDKALMWLEESVAEIRWGSGGKHRRPVKDKLIVAVFRALRVQSREATTSRSCSGVDPRPAAGCQGERGATCPRTRCWNTSWRSAPATPSTSWRRPPPGSGGRGSRAR
jgi:hypothetical protein